MCSTRSAIYVAFDQGRASPEEPERSELGALDPRTLAVRWKQPIVAGRDVHSMCATPEGVLAASTGTDEVLKLRIDPARGVLSDEVVWHVGGDARGDQHHLNGVAPVGGRTLVCGFGSRPKPDAWLEARRGFVIALADGEQVLGPLYHPHSICELPDGEFAVCESPRRRVVTNKGRSSEALPGYARGSCVARGKLYVGTSRNRHPSEPRSLLPYDPSSSPVDGEGIAAVCELDLTSLVVERIIELKPHGREVYDIVGLP